MYQPGKCKILLLGESAVGKTSLFKRFTNHAHEKITPTIGVEYKQKVVELTDGTTMKTQLWDTAGTERYRTITPICYRNVDGVLIIFDITDAQSYRNTQYWFDQLNEKGEEKVQVILVGNKNDKEPQRAVEKEEAEQMARKHGVSYLETSSLSEESTNLLFMTLIQKIIKKRSSWHPNDLTSKPSEMQSIRLTAVSKRRGKKEQECC